MCLGNDKNHMLGYFGSDLIDLAKNMESQISQFSKQYKGVAVACSGGLDSTALFHILYALTKQKKNFPLAISHTNFGLRSNESEEDQKFLEKLAKDKQVEIFVHRAEKQGGSFPGAGNTQQWARDVRYREFERLFQQGWLIALAHQQDDVAENVILRLARGSSVGAMAGMQEWNPPYWRPLLTVSRQILVEWLDRHQLLHRHDSSNDKMKYSRNVIRHKILPQLESLFPGAKKRIARCGMDAWELGRFYNEALSSQVEAARSQTGVPLAWFLEQGEAVSIQAISAIAGPLKRKRNGLSHQLLRKIWDLINYSASTNSVETITLPAGGGVLEIKDGILRLNDEHKFAHYKRLKQHEASLHQYDKVSVLGPEALVSISLPSVHPKGKSARILMIENLSQEGIAVRIMAPRLSQKLKFTGSLKVWGLKELLLKNSVPLEEKRDMFICTEFLPKEAKTNMVSLGIYWKGALVRPDPKGCLKCVKEKIAVRTFEH